jgi:hypothetical protein
MNVRHETVDTTQLRTGDIVLTHGMRVLLGEEMVRRQVHDRTIVSFDGTVLNLEEVLAEGLVTAGLLRTKRWDDKIHRWVVDREDQWPIQGNQFVTWTVERTTEEG